MFEEAELTSANLAGTNALLAPLSMAETSVALGIALGLHTETNLTITDETLIAADWEALHARNVRIPLERLSRHVPFSVHMALETAKNVYVARTRLTQRGMFNYTWFISDDDNYVMRLQAVAHEYFEDVNDSMPQHFNVGTLNAAIDEAREEYPAAFTDVKSTDVLEDFMTLMSATKDIIDGAKIDKNELAQSCLTAVLRNTALTAAMTKQCSRSETPPSVKLGTQIKWTS